MNVDGKRKYIAVGVTTEEALEQCFLESCVLFCVENPLYSRLRSSIRGMAEAADYDMEDYPQKQIMLLKKARGSIRFDDDGFDPYYPPLSWDGWQS